MILEGIVTTQNPDGSTNVAPMGPEVDAATGDVLVLKPFKTSRTYQNLKQRGEGVFHVTDDVLLLAEATVGQANPPLAPADTVRVPRLADCCRYLEFRVANLDDSAERTRIECQVVRTENVRPFFGFNRAFHAVIEAAILVSRLGMIPANTIRDRLDELDVLVAKTGSAKERQAFDLLRDRVTPSAGEPIRVRAPARLHFGFLSCTEEVGRRYGGIGLMIRDPAIEVAILPSASPDECRQRSLARGISPSIIERVESLRRRWADHLQMPIERIPAVDVLSSPLEHVGLGVGTQLSLSVGKGIVLSLDRAEEDEQVRLIAMRGRRSAVGMFGWKQGGLLVDAGIGAGANDRSLITRRDFPNDWSVLLLFPSLPSGLSGADEERALRDNVQIPADISARLCQIVLLEMIPAVDEHDVATFGRALAKYNRLVGDCFRPAQGGPFAHPRIEEIVDALGRLGIGAAQSSWGPTTFAILGSAAEAESLGKEMAREFSLTPDQWLVTSADSAGAQILRESEGN